VHVEFIEWAGRYDSGGPEMRSRAMHEAWLATLPCPVVRLEGDLSVDAGLARLQAMLPRGRGHAQPEQGERLDTGPPGGQDLRRAMAMGTHIGPGVLGAVIFWVASSAGGASAYEGHYAGIITCDVIPGQTVQSLKTDFSMKVVDGEARYQRDVLRPTGKVRQGVTERGTGTVSSSGEVSLTGSAAGQGWSYQATYRGRFDGGSLRLSGTQVWYLPNRAAHPRPCQIAVSRSE
jgi:hypothetical protein